MSKWLDSSSVADFPISRVLMGYKRLDQSACSVIHSIDETHSLAESEAWPYPMTPQHKVVAIQSVNEGPCSGS